MKSAPKISVVIPVYNGERQVQGAILSVLGQDYPNRELIVIDDCSSDHSREVLSKLSEARKGEFISIRNSENLGLSRNLNKAIGLAKAPDYIFILQNDCSLHEPDYLSKMVAYFEKDKTIGIMTGKPLIAKPESLKFVEKLNILLFINDVFEFESGIQPISYSEGKADLYRFSALRQIGLFDEHLKMACEDQIISRKFRDAGFKVLQANELRYELGYGGNQDRYLKLLRHLFDVAKRVPYVIRKYPSLSWRDDSLTRTRQLQRKLRFSHCLSALFTAMVLALSFVDLRLLALLFPLFLWRSLDYLRLVRLPVSLTVAEKALFVLTGIVVDYVYSAGMVWGTLSLAGGQRI
jgi:GT2 family glycosyltransferase